MRILAQLLVVAGLVLAVLGLAGVPGAFVVAAGLFVAAVLLPRRPRHGPAARPGAGYRPQPLQRWDART